MIHYMYGAVLLQIVCNDGARRRHVVDHARSEHVVADANGT